MNPPNSEPRMPSAAVIIKPMGWRPGIKSRATAPMIKPKTAQARAASTTSTAISFKFQLGELDAPPTAGQHAASNRQGGAWASQCRLRANARTRGQQWATSSARQWPVLTVFRRENRAIGNARPICAQTRITRYEGATSVKIDRRSGCLPEKQQSPANRGAYWITGNSVPCEPSVSRWPLALPQQPLPVDAVVVPVPGMNSPKISSAERGLAYTPKSLNQNRLAKR